MEHDHHISCPQCGATEPFYYYYAATEVGLMACDMCGFRLTTCDFYDEGQEGNCSKGYGGRFSKYEDGLTEHIAFARDVDYDMEVEEFDRLLSERIIKVDRSYLTKAIGKEVVFLRGNMEIAKNFMPS
jgi:hypothetical protein